jgi:hypothetical protein
MDFGFVSTPIGDLKIKEVLLYLDGPKIFYCSDEKGTLYLAYFIDELDDYDEWFFV